MFNITSRVNIKNIFDRDPNKFELRPDRPWAVIFFVGTALSTAILAAHFFIYVSLSSTANTRLENSEAEPEVIRLNRKGLSDTAKMFETKDKQFQELLSSPPQITDPSLKSGTGDIPVKTPQNATGTIPELPE